MAECFINGQGGSGNSDYEFTFSADGKFQYPAKVIIPNTVTSLRGSSLQGFYQHSEIEEVEFENDSVITEIPNNCFSGCIKLRKILIPKLVEKIDIYAFSGDINLESVNFESDEEKTVSVLNQAFYNCSNLKEFNLDNVLLKLDGNKIFYNCTALDNDLVQYIISHTDTTSSGNYLFENCSSITDIETNFVAQYMFQGCDQLKNAVIGYEGSTVRAGVFSNCTALENVSINSLVNMGVSFFENCTSLKEVVLPSNLTTLGNGIFKNCSGIENIIFNSIPNCAAFTYVNTNNPFYGCTALKNISFPNEWNQNIIISNGTTNFTNSLTAECLKNIFESLYDYTNGTAHTLQIGTTHLQLAINTTYVPEGGSEPLPIINIAYNKNWTVS